MITSNRWQHILGVARKAKILAQALRPNDEKYSEDMFLLGMLHDFGYEFTENGKNMPWLPDKFWNVPDINIGKML